MRKKLNKKKKMKKLITGLAVVAVLVVAIVLLRGCGADDGAVWDGQKDMVTDPYAQASARYVWPEYEGETLSFEGDASVLEKGTAALTENPTKVAGTYLKENIVDLEKDGVYTLHLTYKSKAPAVKEGEEPKPVQDVEVEVLLDGNTPALRTGFVLRASEEAATVVLTNYDNDPQQIYMGAGKHLVTVKGRDGLFEITSVKVEAVETYNNALQVSVPENALYAMTLVYEDKLPYAGGATIEMKLDGVVPFTEMGAYVLAPSKGATEQLLVDENGNPYLFSLTAGEHILTFGASKDGARITGVKLSSSLLPVYDGEEIPPVETALSLVNDDPAKKSGEVTIEVPEDARYEIWLTYVNTADTTLPTELSIAIDGEIVSEEMKRVKLTSVWVDDGTIPLDRYGNEIAPTPKAQKEPQTAGISDSTGRTSVPLLFELTAGAHTLTFTVQDGGCDITAVTLRKPSEVPAYEPGSASGKNIIVIEAEKIASRNESSIRGAGEFNARLNPYDNDHRKINFLDGASFDEAGEMVTWNIKVPADGWYYLGAYYRQSARADYPTYVDILVDGEIPSTGAMKVAFPYTTSFDTMQAKTADGKPLVLYLTTENKTLSFRINADYLTPMYKTIDALLVDINEISNDIKSLMGGAAADPYRDYQMDEYFPDLVDRLNMWADMCSEVIEYTRQYADGNSISAFSSMTLCADQLRRLSEEPEELPRRMTEFSTGANSAARMLAQQLTDLANNDLSIDQIYLYQADAKLPEKPGFFKNAWAGVQRFFTSFTSQDYAAGSSTETTWVDEKGTSGKQVKGEEYPVIQVWMGRSRQYVETLQNMIDSQFTPATGIRVNLSLMPDANKLVLANAAGTAPDAVLGLQYVVPSYLNIRGALYDLTQFEDFGLVAQRFSPGLFIPYILEDGVYAMPETVNFWVMFYRKDILESLEIPVPNSMDEVKLYLPELQRRSMNFYYPTAGMVGMKVFPGTLPLILQRGGSIYGETIGDTTLDSEISLAGFREMTELFTIYNMPTDVPSPGFYQQFRDGTLPIGIADLATYNLLLNAAPELDGLWDIALFPGLEQVDKEGNPILDENGEPVVERWTTGGAETMAIMSAAAERGYEDEAWEFLKWWSSTEVQKEFGNLLQSTYGSEYIWPTANSEAFANLPLRSEHKEVIIEQMEWMTEAPWVLGTYMLERELSNAFISVTADGVEARRAMDTAVKRINRETYRKLEEFGYEYDQEAGTSNFPTPTVDVITNLIDEYNKNHPAEAGVEAGDEAGNTTEGGTAE